MKKIEGWPGHRYVQVGVRPVFRVRMKPNALALWYCMDTDSAISDEVSAFFERIYCKEIDVYRFDEIDDEDADYFEVNDDNFCLRRSMFDILPEPEGQP